MFHLDLVAAVFGMKFGETSALSSRGVRPGGVVRAVPGSDAGSRSSAAGIPAQLTPGHDAGDGTQGNHLRRERGEKKMLNMTSFTGGRICAGHGFKCYAADIVETAVARNFNTLVAAVKAAALVDTLKGPGPFTVFAPTDEAFAKLPPGTLESLLKPENKEKLQKILTYHVVAGKVMAKDVVKLQSAKTVEGGAYH